MKIVFLDAATVDYGDIDFSEIARLGELETYDITPAEEVSGRIGKADVVITNKVVCGKNVLAQCPGVKCIAVAATGVNNIDLEEAKKRGVAVTNVPGYSTASVAQHTMCTMLALAGHLVEYNSAAHDGTWSSSPVFTIGSWPTFDLKDRVLGIMGYGDIGKEVGRLAAAFGMNVVALRREGVKYEDDMERYDLYRLAEISDFVSVHMPLTDHSHHLVDMEFLRRMKPSAYIINMARGPVIDPAALADALNKKMIAGAALDVMEKEPPDKDDPLLSAPGCIITPHIAWASIESRKRLVHEMAENIAAFSRGEKRNRVV